MIRFVYMAAGCIGTAIGIAATLFSGYCAISGRTTCSNRGYAIAPWQHAIIAAFLVVVFAKTLVAWKKRDKG